MKQFAKLLAVSFVLTAASSGCSDNLSSILNSGLRTSLDSAVSRGRVALGSDSSASHRDSSIVHHDSTTSDTTDLRHSGDTTEAHHSCDVGDTTRISQHEGGGIDSTRHGGGSSGGGSNGGGSNNGGSGSNGGGGLSDSTSHGGGHH